MKPFLAEPFASLWAQQDIFAAAEALQGQVYRELEGRRTLRTEVGGHGYFVKIQAILRAAAGASHETELS